MKMSSPRLCETRPFATKRRSVFCSSSSEIVASTRKRRRRASGDCLSGYGLTGSINWFVSLDPLSRLVRRYWRNYSYVGRGSFRFYEDARGESFQAKLLASAW